MRLFPFRLTIERLRTLVLLLAGLLLVALAGSLVVKHFRNRLKLSDVPKRLGVDIQQEANGVTYTQSRGGRTLYKIRTSKVVQTKSDGKALLHDVQIELYGADGSQVDRISGNEFEYDQKAGIATAAGPVEITIMKPGMAPAVAPKAVPEQAVADKAKGTVLGDAAQKTAAGQIDVKTSGLTFDQKTNTATTQQRVEFALAQGEGSAVGATFDSNGGRMVLDHDVELNVKRNGETIAVKAQHAEFERTQRECELRGASASYRKGKATAAGAKLLFREDGSVVRLDARGGFALATAAGGKVAAPQGWLEFNGKNQPQRGHLEGGVVLDSKTGDAVTGGRQSHGTAPAAELAFTAGGDLRHAHLETGVEMHSEEDVAGAHVSRDWRSKVADVEFKPAAGAKGRMEIASVVGQGGVTVNGQTRRGDGVEPSRMAADAVTALFANGQVSQVNGVGRASMEQTAASGAVQTTTGDKLEARFAGGGKGAAQIESVVVDGNVVMTQTPAKAGDAPLRATGGHAVYEGAGQWLHLTGNPWVRSGGMEMTAERIDVAQGAGKSAGDAFAHGNVKATWANDSAKGSAGFGGMGGQGPSHVIAKEAEFHQGTGEAAFRGQARLWQDANSVTAPVIVLDKAKKTLVAHGDGGKNPVRLALLSAGGMAGPGSGLGAGGAKKNTPSVVRVTGGDLVYSDAERKAVLRAALGGTVMAEMGTAETSNSQTVELVLAAAGARKENAASQVEKMTARGNVVLTSAGRQATGEQLVYAGQTGEYVLTGTSAAAPKMTDAEHGTVTGKALIFNSRDDSVRIEGAETKTTVVSHTPGK